MLKNVATRDFSISQPVTNFTAGATAAPDELPTSYPVSDRRVSSFTGSAKGLLRAVPPDSAATPHTCADVAELIEHCGRGDARAWDTFVARYHHQILVFVLRASRGLGGPASNAYTDASDLVQEVYLRLLANDRRLLREFRGTTEASLLSYLVRTVVSAVTDCARRKRSKKRTAKLVPLETLPGAGSETGQALNSLASPETNEPGRQLDDRLALAWLQKLLEETLTGPNRHRNALIFFQYAIDELTAREITSLSAAGLTVGNVESIIFRTREQLRLRLGDSSASSAGM
jgi:RNA polymerase sigma factor (sigma-70 family)